MWINCEIYICKVNHSDEELGNGSRDARSSMHIMDSALYNSIGHDLKLQRVKRLVDNAVRKEIGARRYPVMPDVETRSVGVSFPSQIGFSTYDLETAR